MEYEQYTLEELQKMFENEQNREELVINMTSYLIIMKKLIMSN